MGKVNSQLKEMTKDELLEEYERFRTMAEKQYTTSVSIALQYTRNAAIAKEEYEAATANMLVIFNEITSR